jgi:predicted ribosomally synthesized peptide with nif11-like leader
MPLDRLFRIGAIDGRKRKADAAGDANPGGNNVMSKSELERFAADLNEDQALFDQVSPVAGDHAALVAIANANGYDFTLEEVQAHVSAQREISDEQLDEVAGGRNVPVIAPKVVVNVTTVIG